MPPRSALPYATAFLFMLRNELTNLLPLSRKRTIVRDYHLRVGVVFVALFTVLVLAAGVLLLPTYVYLTGDVLGKEARLAAVKGTLASLDGLALSSRLAALSNDASVLLSFSNKSSASNVMRSVLGIPRSGIILSGFTYTPTGGSAASALVLSGTAATRDALRAYQLALQSAPFAKSVELPVSAYAKDANISFSITITLAP